jgi:hypothetical protein
MSFRFRRAALTTPKAIPGQRSVPDLKNILNGFGVPLLLASLRPASGVNDPGYSIDFS